MLLLALIVIFILVMLGESLRHVIPYHPEISRKFIHITVAGFAATWPLFLSRTDIVLISIFLFAGIVASRYLAFFESIHSIGRKTWGELFFAMSFGVVALMTGDALVYAAAILLMGVADGLAGIIGSVYGKDQTYKVFSGTKSVIGTTTFWVLSLIIVAFCIVLNGQHASWTILLWFPFAAALLENISISGADNLIIPIFTAIILGEITSIPASYGDLIGSLLVIALAAVIIAQLTPSKRFNYQRRFLAYVNLPVRHILARRR